MKQYLDLVRTILDTGTWQENRTGIRTISMPGAMLGGVLIGLIRAMSDQYIETRWTNVVVFGVLILILVFRPSGLLGLKQREKV